MPHETSLPDAETRCNTQDVSSPSRSTSPALDPADALHLTGCKHASEVTQDLVGVKFGFWATRFMEMFQYCTESQVMVHKAYHMSGGSSTLFVEEMRKRGLKIGHAKFLFDMLESVALDIDTLEPVD